MHPALLALALLHDLSPAHAAGFDGRWVVATPEADILSAQDASLARAMASMSAPVRVAASAVLRRSLTYCKGYDITVSSTDLHLVCDTRTPIDARFGAPPTALDPGSGAIQLTAAIDGAPPTGTVRVRLKSADGARESQLRLEGEELVVTVTVESPRFDEPVNWTVRYRRP